ncbi:MAG: DUF3267 domain-containing protein [Sphaerochaetaceae bacterium]|nr:DUF3267 domain-containing protein [Sphaerochaetaceae bacterium]
MNVRELPDGYRLIGAIDLQKDPKSVRVISLMAVAIGIACYFVGRMRTPIGNTFLFSGRFSASAVRISCAFACMFLYLILHEWIHGVFIRFLGKVKPKYGYEGIYLYAGTDQAWFDRKSYIVIALAPIVVWGLVLGFISWISADDWFWVFYFVQIINLSGSAGDLFITVKMLRMPAGTLVQDTGTAMAFYGRG